WAKKGHILAMEQIELENTKIITLATDNQPNAPLSLTKNDTEWIVSNTKFTIKFDVAQGLLTTYEVAGHSLVQQPLKANYWRAPTDNDRLGWKTPKKLAYWKTAAQQQQLIQIREIITTPEKVTIKIVHQLPDGKASQSNLYEILADGTLKVSTELEANPQLPYLPRLGHQFGLDKAFSNIRWFGKGPYENYSDRNQAAFVGQYESTLANFPFSYVYPQENGNRTETRWVHFLNEKGQGLSISGNRFNFGAHPYTNENLETATSICELKEIDYININLDHKQMGVGGFNSWSDKAAPLERYRVPAGNYSYKMIFQPIGF
ncbi:MAG: beta-galactosidase small subunit, partial [Bacteroidota bacterium]